MRLVSAACTASIVFALSVPAYAGPTDTALPTFSDGKPALHVYTAVGVIKNNGFETVCVCSNLGGEIANIALEVFDKTGAPITSVGADEGVALSVAVGATTTFATGATAAVTEDVQLVGLPNIANGSARIVASIRDVSCTAWILDEVHSVADPSVTTSPPPAGFNLPLVYVP